MRRRELITGAAALAAYAALSASAAANLKPTGRLWPLPKAALHLDFANQRYWWAGRERTTSEFSSFALGSGRLGQNGLTAADDTVIRVALSAFANNLVPGAIVCICTPTSTPGTARRIFELHDTTAAERINISQSANGALTFLVVDASVIQVQSSVLEFSTYIATQAIAASWTTNNSLVSMRGIIGPADTLCTMPSPTVLQIGNGQAATTTFLGDIAAVIGFDWSFYQWTADDLGAVSMRLSR